MPKPNIKKSKSDTKSEAVAPPVSLDAEIVEDNDFDKKGDTDDPIQPSLISDFNLEKSRRSSSSKGLFTTVMIALIAGLVGGYLGSAFLPGLVGFPGSNSQDPQSLKTVVLEEDSAIIDVVQKSNPAVVSIIVTKDLPKVEQFLFNPFGEEDFFIAPFEINTPGGELKTQQIGAGSGFIVDSDGLIITNKHVVSDEDADYTVITFDGTRYKATVLAVDPLNDLAIVKIDAKDLPIIELGDSSKVVQGQKVIAIGNTLGELRNTVTTGVVSGIGRTVTAGDRLGSVQQLDEVIQTDAAINPGNSGGPLLNLAGQVIGINTAIDQAGQLVGFSIPSNEARKALADTLEHGRILRPFLGIRYVLVNEEFALSQNLPVNYGALVVEGDNVSGPGVTPDTPAAVAGVKEGDIILEINGKTINENNTLIKILKDYDPGDEVVLTVQRGDEQSEILLKLGERE